MFTGLVQAVGTVQTLKRPRKGEVTRLEILPRRQKSGPPWDHVPAPGSSISISGCCLTVVNHPKAPGEPLAFEVVEQTLATTKFGSLTPGDQVNLEHACTPTTLLGGHLVQGHVDTVAKVAQVRKGGDYRVQIELPAGIAAALTPCILPKGSITLDGVSLTVARLLPKGFEVALIPATLAETTLGSLRPGDQVNLEVDLITKAVTHCLTSVLPTLLESLEDCLPQRHRGAEKGRGTKAVETRSSRRARRKST